MTDKEQISELEDEVRILKQYHEVGQLIHRSELLTGSSIQHMVYLELHEIIREYKEFLYRRDHPHE